MADEDDVLAAAGHRATALARGDAETLTTLPHPAFTWATHTGQRFDRASYIARNTSGITVWRDQGLLDPHVTVIGDTAVLTTTVADTVVGPAGDVVYRMPVTMTWVRDPEYGWRCLAGHAGPRLDWDMH